MESKDGWLQKTINYINENYPDIFTIADANGDIGNSSSMYAKAFEDLNFDSVTVVLLYGKRFRNLPFSKQTYYHVGFDVK
jgi:orotidine-5'-phosphate decarboxylase